MGRAPRLYSENGVYHILFRGVNQQNIFEEHSDYEQLKTIIRKVKSEMDFELYAYCFMNNHVHLVLKEKNIKDISLIMKKILSKYVRWYNIKYGRSGALIANRYKSVPVEIDEHFLQLIRYVHQNPVKAKMTNNIEDYLYSSYSEYVDKEDISDTEFVYGMINKNEFKNFHKDTEELEFTVTDSTRKSDTEVAISIQKQYKINSPKEISKLAKTDRNKILGELLSKYSVRQLQRVTGVSRGVMTKLK